MSEHDESLPSLDHLRWQCRRGMLELDYILRRYLDTQYGSTPEAERQQFVRLLTIQDQDLLAWLVHGQAPTDPTLADLVRKVRGID